MNHIKTLTGYNAWRLGADMPQPDAGDITIAINGLIFDHQALQDRYRTEQSLHAAEKRSRIEAQTQLEHMRRGADMYGVMQGLALHGKKHPKETPMDGRLDAIRSLVAHNAKLTHELAEVQRLYQKATVEAMEAHRRADRWKLMFEESQSFLDKRIEADRYQDS